jgi:hypothetical protein
MNSTYAMFQLALEMARWAIKFRLADSQFGVFWSVGSAAA